MNKDFSTGSIKKHIFSLAIPMIAAMLINALYSIVDRIYIGHIAGDGQLALTGIGLCFPITMLVTAFAYLIGNGGGPLVSIALGEENKEKAEKILGNSITTLVILGIVVMVVCLAIKKPILYLFGASDSTYPYANQYITIYILGTLAVMLTLGMNPFINAQGYAKTGMMTVCIGAIVNIVLDPIFIFGFHLGIRGAAIATILAQLVSALWVIRFLTGKKAAIRIKKENLKLDGAIVKSICALGFASFIMNLTESALSAVFNASLRDFGGDLYVTVMTVITSVSQVIFMPLAGFAQGATPVIGYNYGAKQFDRVKQGFRFMLLVTGIYAVTSWLLTMLCPQLLVRVFNSDETLIAAAVPMFRIYFSMNFIMCLQMCSQNTFVAVGDAKKATFFAIFRKLILLIPLILILPRIGMGLVGVFAAEPIADTISALTCFLTFMLTKYRKWK